MTTTAQLNTGNSLPAVGLGCWMGDPGYDGTEKMVKTALSVGYRHFDTASGYGNEAQVGKALRESGVPRGELFLTTKLNGPDHGRVLAAFDKSLEELGTEYIDLFLMHWPQASNFLKDSKPLGPNDSPTFTETWKDMETLFDQRPGKIKQIGVSNFSIKNLEILLPSVKIVPAVNQVEAHPFLPNDKLFAYCKEKGVHCTAYSPVGQGPTPILSHSLIQSLATKYTKPAGSVVLSWAVQRGWSVVPKSSNEGRLRANLDTFKLEEEDMEAINNLHKEPGNYRSLCDYGVPPSEASSGLLFGWRIKEDLGWDYEITTREENWLSRAAVKGKKE